MRKTRILEGEISVFNSLYTITYWYKQALTPEDSSEEMRVRIRGGYNGHDYEVDLDISFEDDEDFESVNVDNNNGNWLVHMLDFNLDEDLERHCDSREKLDDYVCMALEVELEEVLLSDKWTEQEDEDEDSDEDESDEEDELDEDDPNAFKTADGNIIDLRDRDAVDERWKEIDGDDLDTWEGRTSDEGCECSDCRSVREWLALRRRRLGVVAAE